MPQNSEYKLPCGLAVSASYERAKGAERSVSSVSAFMSLRSEGRLVSVTEHGVTVTCHTVAVNVPVSRPCQHTPRCFVVFNIDLYVCVHYKLCVSSYDITISSRPCQMSRWESLATPPVMLSRKR